MPPAAGPIPPLDALNRATALVASSRSRDEVLCEVLEAVCEAGGYGRAAAFLLAGGGSRLERLAEAGTGAAGFPATVDPEEPAAAEARAGRTGRPWIAVTPDGPVQAWSEDAAGAFRLCVPVWNHERVFGVLAVERGPGPPPGRDEVDLLGVFANLLGVVVENRALHDAHETRIQQLLALQRIGREMTTTLEIGQLLALVVAEAVGLTGAEGGLLYLVEEDDDHLRLEAWSGREPAPERRRVPVGYGIAGWAARNDKSLRVSDAVAPDAGVTARNQLAVPLHSGGRVVGVLGVEGGGGAPFTETHEEILSIFAAQAAKAIEAARYLDEVRRERDLRDSILAGTPNGVVALGPDRRVILMNPAARRLLAVSEPPVGNPIGRYLTGGGFPERLDRILSGHADLESVELPLGSRDDPRQCTVSLFPLGERAARGATVVIQDQTERRRLDERVQRMDRLASIGQLAAGIAHEIRNPLTGVGISLDILREERGLTEAGTELLADINREIDRLEALIRGLLDFARPQPVESRPMRVAKALEWSATFAQQCRKKGVAFRFEIRQNTKLRGDPEKLKQVFLNLAINALEATPPGGEIRLWAEPHRDDGGQWCRVAVEDTGPGLDEATAARMFDPFFTTKNEGTGLGLSIAHSIIQQHGGRMDVHAAPGRGARFVVDLPAMKEEDDR